MQTPIPAISRHRRPGAGVLDPFNVAAYVTWLAVAFDPLRHMYTGTPWSAPYGSLALAAMVAVLVLFLVRAHLDAREAPLLPRRVVILAQAAVALLACWASRNELTPALLVVAAAQIATVYSLRGVVLLLLAINALLALVPFNTPDSITLLIAYLGFQVYTAVGASYGYRIYQGREEALRINAQLLATRQLLEEGARADERLRLSRELHDLAGHKLTALKMQLALCHRQAAPADAPALERCERLAGELLADIRGVVSALRPHEGVDLQRALRALDPGLPRPAVLFELDPELRVAGIRGAEVLLRCAQEALTNAMRHSGAAIVTLGLARTPEGLLLTVADDGRGRSARLRPGNGLRGLRERLEDAGGHLQIADREPAGLVLRALLPDTPSQSRLSAEAPV